MVENDVIELIGEIKECISHLDAMDSYEGLEDKMIALLVYVKDCKEDRSKLIKTYNSLVDRVKGVLDVDYFEEEEALDRQKTGNGEKGIEEEILQQSINLRERTETFGRLTEESKKLIGRVEDSIRGNIKKIGKEMEVLEKNEWWRIGGLRLLWVFGAVIALFFIMYFLIKVG